MKTVLDLIAWFVEGLPEAWGRPLCRGVARGVEWVMPGRSAIARRNIEAAWGRPVPIRTQDVWTHLALTAWDFLRVKRHRSRGFDHVGRESALSAALALGRGAIVATGHLGSWELVAAALASRMKVRTHVVAKSLGVLDAWLLRRRRQAGLHTLAAHGGLNTARAALRALAAGEIVVVVIDQHAPTSACLVPFFGRLAATTVLPTWLAYRSGAPLVWLSTFRTPRGEHPVEVGRMDAADFDSRAGRHRGMAELTGRLERAVRAHPAQWPWTHRRWKVSTRAVVPEDDAR